jgi:hypothetical protein
MSTELSQLYGKTKWQIRRKGTKYMGNKDGENKESIPSIFNYESTGSFICLTHVQHDSKRLLTLSRFPPLLPATSDTTHAVT